MSGAVAALAVASAGIVNPLPAMTISHSTVAPATASGSMSLSADGGISGSHYSGPALYYNPSVVGIGANFWVKFTLNSGDAWNAGLTAGTVYALSSGRTLNWSVSSAAKIADVTVSIYSDAGGANLVTSGTLSVNVDSAI